MFCGYKIAGRKGIRAGNVRLPIVTIKDAGDFFGEIVKSLQHTNSNVENLSVSNEIVREQKVRCERATCPTLATRLRRRECDARNDTLRGVNYHRIRVIEITKVFHVSSITMSKIRVWSVAATC